MMITRMRNAWGWYIASAIIDGYLVEMRYDEKPTRARAKVDLIAESKRKARG